MKAILMSINPKHSKNILNEIKTLEIRKKFPKDYVGWVYIYNTKTTKDGVLKLAYIGNKLEFILSYDKTSKYQGKVVARFWCDKVEHFEYETCSRDISGYFLDNGEKFNTQDNCKKMCLDGCDLWNYIGCRDGYAIHITNLEIFDKPKELSDFKRVPYEKCGQYDSKGLVWCGRCPYGIEEGYGCDCKYNEPLKAPQSWCYIEV